MILFSTGCPRCKVLERKLSAKGIEYRHESDVNEIIQKGFMSVPVLKTDDGQYLDFAQANAYVNAL